MIDSHTHTFYSKHAIGTVNELVREAVSKGIEVLTITDHAPFYIDRQNRLLDSELDHYFADIDRAKRNNSGLIKVLCGLEMDYMPGAYDYSAKMLGRYDLDFVIGSIHYIPLAGSDQVKVWEISRFANADVLESYFKTLVELLECGLFDAVGHADTLLRGISDTVLSNYFEPLLPLFAQHNVAFELNASGLRKTSLNQQTRQEVNSIWSYPSLSLVQKLISLGANFTIGSDAHAPLDAGAGVQEIVDTLMPLGLKRISYFEGRKPVNVPVKALVHTFRGKGNESNC